MEGWLDWEGLFLPAIPVDIANFAAGGVAVWVREQLELSPGDHGVLITKAHGRSCGYQFVGLSRSAADWEELVER